MNSVTKHIGYLGLLVAFTLSNLGASHAGDLTGYDADGDGLIDYLDDNGNLWPNQQAWEASNAFVTAIEVAEPELSPTEEPALDSDGDGLTDEEETTLGTDPLVADTDGGGLNDYEETHDDDWRATDPLNPYDDLPTNDNNSEQEASNDLGNGGASEEVASNADSMSTSEFLFELAQDSAALGGALLYVPCPPVQYTGFVLLGLSAVFAFGGFVAKAFEGPESNDPPENTDPLP